jgi:hypothetical protein
MYPPNQRRQNNNNDLNLSKSNKSMRSQTFYN